MSRISRVDRTKPTKIDPSVVSVTNNFGAVADDVEDIFVELDQKLGKAIKSTGIHKLWPSAGAPIANRVGEDWYFDGTGYQKIELEAQPLRVRARLTQRSNTPLAYSQSGNLVTVNYLGQAAEIGDKVYIRPYVFTTGSLKPGWYTIVDRTPGVNIVYKAAKGDSQTATGTCLFAHISKNWKVAFAMTEVMANDSVSNATSPIVSGVAHDVIASSSDQYGWYVANFNPDYGKNPIITGDIPAASMTSQYDHGVSFSVASDWIYLPKVLPTTGTRPFLLMRHEHYASTGGDHSWVAATTIKDFLANESTSAPHYRRVWNKFMRSKYGVTTPTDVPDTFDNNDTFYTMFEVDYGVESESVFGIGDSTMAFASYGLLINGVPKFSIFGGYLNRATLAKSTPQKPYTVYNGGMGGHVSETYFNQLSAALEANVVPTILVIQGHSINDSGSPTVFHFTNSKTRILKAIDLARRKGVRKILVCTWPMTASISNNSTVAALVNEHNTWIRNLAINKISDGAPDFEQVRLDLTNTLFFSVDGVTNYPTAVGGVAPDGIHQGPAGIVGLQNELAKFL